MMMDAIAENNAHLLGRAAYRRCLLESQILDEDEAEMLSKRI